MEEIATHSLKLYDAGRQPSFSGCRRQDLERSAGQSRLHNVVTFLSAPPEDIFCSRDLSRSTAVDLALVYITQATIKRTD